MMVRIKTSPLCPTTPRLLVCAFTLVACVTMVSAQSYTMVPNDSVSIVGWLEDNQELTIEQLNTTADTIRLQWSLIDEQVPSPWDASVCDNSFCYTTLVSGGVMKPVPPNGRGKIMIRFTPRVNKGIAQVQYAVWDAQQPDARDTLTFILRAEQVTSVANRDVAPIACTYDRTHQMISITTSSTIPFITDVIDMLGTVVHSGVFSGSSLRIPIHGYASGMYIVRIRIGDAISTQHILKQ